MTEWKPIVGYREYLANDQGMIKIGHTGAILQQTMNQQGHAKVNLRRGGTDVTRSVARIVANLYLEKPGRRDFDTLIHLNGDKMDNRVENLQWRPRHFAVKYHAQFDNPLQEANRRVQDMETLIVYPTVIDAAKEFGLLINDIIICSYARTVVWPTFQQFLLVEE